MTRAELENKMTVSTGDRAAEAALIGEISAGADDQIDLAVRALVDAAFGRAETLARRHPGLIEQAMTTPMDP